jgi:hypothetical protein
MILENVCVDIEKSLREIYDVLKKANPNTVDDIFKLASGMIHSENIFSGEDIAFFSKKGLYEKVVDKGVRLELLQMQYLDLVIKLLDSIENIHDEKTTDILHKQIVDIEKKYDENLGIYKKVFHNVQSRRLVVQPIREIIGMSKSRTLNEKLEMGHSYMFLLDKSDRTFDIFATYVKDGYHGLCISRYFPMKIRKKYGLEKTPMLWLSHTDSEESHLDPSNLGVLTNVLRDFFQKTEKGIVLLEGLEYLIIQNGFDTVLRFIQYLNEHVVTNKVILVVPFNKESIAVRELALLKSELEVIEENQKK